jgi:hypothetical protein
MNEMNKRKWTLLLGGGILAAAIIAVAAGCMNPTETADLAEESSAVGERSEPGVITLTVLGEEGPGAQASRSVIGPDAHNFNVDGVRNVM